MFISITGAQNNKRVYITKSYRKENGKTSSKIHRKLGNLNELLEKFSGDYEAMMIWAKAEAQKDTEEYQQETCKTIITLSRTTLIPENQERCFQIGYLFLKKILYELKLDSICQKISKHHEFTFDLNAILFDLVLARVLAPASKLSSYSYCQTMLESPKYQLHNIYRALSVMAEESDYIQEMLYRNSNFIHPRKQKILYYDCTNYYFEIEQDDELRRYGKSKEHRPNPIVTMGLFMDGDDIPLAFDIFPGNQNEQTTLKSLESKIIHDYEYSDFIFCSDAGLGSKANRWYNSLGKRAYIIAQSLKKLRKEDKQYALSPKNFYRLGSPCSIDISTLDESNPDVFETVYYKELPLENGDLSEMLIVTYSPKYKAYQRKIREQQIQHAQKMIDSSSRNRRSKNENDPARFIKKISITKEGEIASKDIYSIDQNRIEEESKYDGFYAVTTNLEGDVAEIIRINKQRWRIEESFRIMKTEFEARPVFVRREERIKAHFLICYIALLVYRLLTKKLKEEYTCEEILNTLRSMQVTLLSKESGYIPSYKRTDLTDKLHETFGFRTDYEFISKSMMRNILKQYRAN